MTEHDDHQIRDALKQSLPPVNTELRRDLWPDVLRKLDARSVRVPWYDWALVGLSAAMFLAFPRLVLVFAYHLEGGVMNNHPYLRAYMAGISVRRPFC